MKETLWALIGMVIAILMFAVTHACYAQQAGMAGHGHRAGYAQPGHASAQMGQATGLKPLPWSYFAEHYDPNSVDRFQPWPQAEMKRYQKP